MIDGLDSCIEGLTREFKIEAMYLYGSYVNGYYERDSDIDLVALTNTDARKKPLSLPPNISVHMINPLTVRFFETGIPYAHLRMVPLLNESRCVELSNNLKCELVRRELIRFKRKGIVDFGILDPINNYLLGYGIERPWRIKPIKRIFKSIDTSRILTEEYQRIVGILEEKGMLEKIGGNYRINKDFVFDDETGPAQVSDSLRFKFKNSYSGWHYLVNLPTMIDFTSKRI